MKKNIQRAFDRAALTYDDHCQLQDETNASLIRQLKSYKFSSDVIVDLGCGTGNSTQQLVAAFPHKKLYAVDFSAQLLQQAKNKLTANNIEFHVADFDALAFPPASIDLAFANMALQWSACLPTMLKNLAMQVKHEGIVGFSIPLAGTLDEMHESHRNVFYSLEEITAMLQQADFNLLRAEPKTYTYYFDSVISSLKAIKKIGANCRVKPSVNLHLQGKGFLKNIFKLNKDNRLTYQIGFFIAQKT